MTQKSVTPASLAAQAMGWIDPVTKAVVPPIHMASTYLRDEDNGYRSGRIYARADNPTFDQAEATLAALEGGAKALVFSSGMSAATACFLALAPGDLRIGAFDALGRFVQYEKPRAVAANVAPISGLESAVVPSIRMTAGPLRIGVTAAVDAEALKKLNDPAIADLLAPPLDRYLK